MDSDRIVGSVKSVAGKAERAFGDAVNDKSAQAEGAATQAEGIVQNTIGQAKDAARGAAEAATNLATDAYEQGTDMVAERPGSALLLAGLIGFGLGLIIAKGSQPPRRSRWERVYHG